MASRLDTALGDYLKQIKQYSLLTPDEERELGTRIRSAADAEQRLTRGELTPRQFEEIQHIAAEARERMISANLRLVISVAKNFRHRGLPMEDLVNEGNVGLMQAVDRFDPEVGSRFSTYASYWIDQAIRRAVQMSSQMIHIPSYLMEQIAHMRLAMRELHSRLGREPTVDELAEHMHITSRKAAAIAQAIRACTCPSQSGAPDDGTSVTDALPDTRVPDPSEEVLSQADADLVSRVLSQITEREAAVLQMRYGITSDGGRRLTLKEVGDRVGLTRERVRQIEKEAKRKLEELVRDHV